MRYVAGIGIPCAQEDVPRLIGLEVFDLLLSILPQACDPAGVIVQDPAFSREGNPAVFPVDDARPDGVLQVVDMLGQRGLGEIHPSAACVKLPVSTGG